MMVWNVFVDDNLIDTVFFSADRDPDWVYRSLVEHDGYPTEITVRKA